MTLELILAHWDEILQYIREVYDVPEVKYYIWLKPLRPERVQGNILYIATDMKEMKGVLSKYYAPALRHGVWEVTGKGMDIEFV